MIHNRDCCYFTTDSTKIWCLFLEVTYTKTHRKSIYEQPWFEVFWKQRNINTVHVLESKRLCHDWVVHFVITCRYSLTCEWQNHSFASYKYVSLEYYIKRYKQEKWTLKKCWANNFFKNLYYCNPFQSSSSFPILASCVIYGIYTFFNVSCGYFHITLNWWQFLQFEFQ